MTRLGITAVSIYGNTASSTRVRLTDWFDFLGITDVELLNHAGRGSNRLSSAWRDAPSLIAAERETRRASQAKRERVILSREAALLSRGSVEHDFLANAEHSVYDLDDALFHDVAGLRRVYAKRPKAERAAAAADVVVVGNEYLADWASDFATDVRVIPSCVDPRDYQAKNSWEIVGAPTIVWLGSPATEHYVEQIAGELAEVHRLTSARLRIISGPRTEEHSMLVPFVDRVAWSPNVVADALATADIAIAPLDDSLYARGKCAYKLLQYAASALPIVGSPIGANARALQLFQGSAVQNRKDWAGALLEVLTESADARRDRGLAGRESVTQHFSFNAWRGDWLGAMRLPSAAGGHDR